MGRGYFWDVSNKTEKSGEVCSLIVTEALKIRRGSFKKQGYFYIPGWVHGEIAIPSDFSCLINNRSVHSDLNMIKKHNLGFVVTRDLSRFHQFYYEMYLPLIQSRYGSSAFLHEYDSVQSKFKKCVLLLVKKDGTDIAGIMVSNSKTRGHLWALGVKNGNSEYIKEGAIGALYYYALQYLQQKDCRTVDAGTTRAFLKDGVLRYKKKWGLKIIRDSPAGFFIKTMDGSAGVRGFLLNNPFITTDNAGLGAVVFTEEENLGKIAFEKIRKNHSYTGLKKLILCSFTNDGSISQISTI
jgi:hypothetical protein